MGRRQDKKARLRAALHESAAELFAERGFEQTRVRDIIERVGVSEATFYNYFPTKQSLLAQSADELKGFYTALLHHLVARDDEPAGERVHELVRVVGKAFVNERRRLAAMVDRTSLFFGATGATKEHDLANFALLAELFRQGQAAGEIDPEPDPLQLAEIVSAVMILTINNWITDWWGDVGHLEPRLRVAVDVVLRGCSTQPASS